MADYDEVHAAFMARIERAHRELANWHSEDFALALVADSDAVYQLRAAEAAAEGAQGELAVVPSTTKTEVTAADKLVLQNYGRPYDGAKPGGTYFQFACDTAAPVPNWLSADE